MLITQLIKFIYILTQSIRLLTLMWRTRFARCANTLVPESPIHLNTNGVAIFL